MQLIPVYLYPNKLDVFTNSYEEVWKTERYRQVYQKNIKIHRGVDNRIDFQVKNSDQKPLSIVGSSLVFVLVDKEQNRLILEKSCEIQSLALGRIFVEIGHEELFDIEPGFYNFSLLKENREDVDSTEHRVIKRTPVYVDSNYSATGIIEVLGDLKGNPIKSLEIKEFKQDVPENYTEPYTFYSSIISARPELNNGSSMHTFQFYMTDYNGEVTIQGSLSDGASPNIWIDINDPITVIGSNLKYKNIVGKYNWFRIKHIPNRVSSTAEFVVAQTILNSYTVSIKSGGRGYIVGDTITISGARLGGETPANNLVITVTSVDVNGTIIDFSHSGVSYAGVKTFVLSGDHPITGTIDKILYR